MDGDKTASVASRRAGIAGYNRRAVAASAADTAPWRQLHHRALWTADSLLRGLRIRNNVVIRKLSVGSRFWNDLSTFRQPIER